MPDERKPTVLRNRPEPLGYDTSQPFISVARIMAEDALEGRNQESVDAEIERVRKRWRLRND